MPGDDHGSDDATNDDAGGYVGEYDKLVRDDIPDVVRADGNHPVTRRVDGREYQRYLAAKLREEVDELLDAFITEDAASADRDDALVGERDDALLGELADVHAVLDAICDARGHSRTAVGERAREKADARGGFADGVVLERIDPPTSRDGDAADEP